MWEPLLLTIAVITVPFGLYLAFDRQTGGRRVIRRINRHERIREALRRLSESEEHWDINHLRFDLRQAYRALQKARQQADWRFLGENVSYLVLEEWRTTWERRRQIGVEWRLDPLEIIDVQPINVQNRPGFAKDFVTVEIEARCREYLIGPQGCYREGSGYMGAEPESLPIELTREYWTFLRRQDGWTLVRCDRSFPESLAFVDED